MQVAFDNQNANFYFNLLRQVPGLIVVMDTMSRFIYSNTYTANLFGYSNDESMLGLDAYGMKCHAVGSAPQMIEQDKLVMQTGNELTILDIHQYAYGEPKILLTKKVPYRINGEIAGSICHCTDIHSTVLSDTCAALIESDKRFYSKNNKNERSYTIASKSPIKKLSERELECAYYLLRGNTMKEIARSLLISPRTVEKHLEQIKDKLNCKSRSSIVEHCLMEGLLNYIPKSLISHNVSKVLKLTGEEFD